MPGAFFLSDGPLLLALPLVKPATAPADAHRELTPLWRQLQQAAQALAAVRGGRSATDALAQVPAALRPGVQALLYAGLRQLGRAEALRRLLAPRAPAPRVDALLCLALALAWQPVDDAQAPQGDGARYEPHTLVNQAVEAAKNTPALRGSAGFLNACLRRFLREREALVRQTDADPVAVWNHPRWWIERLQREAPDRWQQVLEANNRQPPLTLRVNRRRAGLEDMLQALADAGLPAHRNGTSGITLERAVPVQQLPGFAQGQLSVQDAAAQLAAELLLPVKPATAPAAMPAGLRVLDACAAPGGKTAHLLERADVRVTALDVDPQRCARIRETLDRLGLQADVRAADAGEPSTWWTGEPYDAILLDAPCTASGIVRRHPDVRWLRRESDLQALAKQQERLLNALWPLVAPGGRLLYCTCSVFRAEGDDRIKTFLAHNKEASLLPSPGHLWPGIPPQSDALADNGVSDHDGFFYALLEKRAG